MNEENMLILAYNQIKNKITTSFIFKIIMFYLLKKCFAGSPSRLKVHVQYSKIHSI